MARKVVLAAICGGIAASYEPLLPSKPLVESYACTLQTIAAQVSWEAAVCDGGAIDAYELQYRDIRQETWFSSSNMITGGVLRSGDAAFEIQTVVTSCNAPACTITAGYFRLVSSYDTILNLDVQTGLSTTPLISYQASASEMQQALQMIHGIPDVRVNRDGPDSNGGYQWHITFHENHPRPILSVATDSLDQGSVHVLLNHLHSPMCEEQCSYIVYPLSNGTSYQFRIRAHSKETSWGPWGIISDIFQTCILECSLRCHNNAAFVELPRAVEALHVASTNQESITVTWSSNEHSTLPIRRFSIGYKCSFHPVWLTLVAFTTTATITGLQPNTPCLIRVQAVNDIGFGPVGNVLSAKTDPGRPSCPQFINLTVDNNQPQVLTLSFAPPADDGGSVVLGYLVSYRSMQDFTWKDIPPLTKTSVQLLEIQPYTRYIARVTAFNSVGPSDSANSHIVRSAIQRVTPTAPLQQPIAAPSSNCILIGTNSYLPANSLDIMYHQGRARGGVNGSDGENGFVLIRLYSTEGIHQQDFTFDISSQPVQTFFVPGKDMYTNAYIDIYAWGGGGGSGKNWNCQTCSAGGGGGFSRAPFPVQPGDAFDIYVGGGGKGINGFGAGGAGGGGNGGNGDFTGGGGGGATYIRKGKLLLLVAGGGGGGGSSDYCCTSGGGAGGAQGLPGQAVSATALQIPLASCSRDEYHSRFVFGDNRDFTGRPAHDMNIDFGYSPYADFSMLAKEGLGASRTSGGQPGQQSSYKWHTSTSPSNGYLLHGGQGGDSKNGGGGGGAGLFGGGGGGGGLAGAGGGGGASFVNCELTYNKKIPSSNLLYPNQLRVLPNVRSLTLQWVPPTLGFKDLVQGYVIEISNGVENKDFQQVGDTRETSFLIDKLMPNTKYSVRVKLLTQLNRGSFTPPVTASTLPIPPNTWEFIHPQYLSQGSVGEGLRRVDPPTAQIQVTPSPRRGHSMIAIDGYVYLFGGFGPGYMCQRGNTATCQLVSQENNELWRYHSPTQTWLQLQVLNGPSPREKHSVVLLSGSMLLFGGRKMQTDGSLSFFNDVWQLHGATDQFTITSNTSTASNLAIADGMDLWTTAIASIDDSTTCIVSMAVTLVLQHACPSSLEIGLYGPGPDTFSPLQQDAITGTSAAVESTWSIDTYNQATSGNVRTTPTSPKTRGHRVELFAVVNATKCTPTTTTMVFAANSSTPPLEPFTKFYHLPAGGVWTLHIHDRFKDGNTGSLLSWNISWTMKPCTPSYQWINATSNIKGTPPSARYQHTAISFGQSMFVFGGKNLAELSDLYRLDYNSGNSSGTWVTLTPMALQRYYRRYGQLMYLSPYQALIFSTGITQQTFNESEQLKLSQYPVMEPNEPLRPIEISGIAPSQRYFTAASILSATINDSRLVFFGGQDHSGFLGDTWEISLKNPPSSMYSQTAACDWRSQSTPLQTDWMGSCGAAQSSQPCSLATILINSWCAKSYQIVHNLH